MKHYSVLVAGFFVVIAACSSETGQSTANNPVEQNVVRVTGEIESANSAFFGPPSIPDVWQLTISFMAPEGRVVKAGTPILKFDPQELTTKFRDKSNALNEKRKQFDKQKIVARETMAELRLSQQEAVADLDKARLKADIPVELLASRDYKENKLALQQAELNRSLKAQELEKEQLIQDTEIKILKREIKVLESEVAQFQISIDAMTIKTESAGVVIHTVDRRNNKHEVGDNVWMGRRVMELPDLTRLQVHLEVPERESARISVGQTVRFVLDAIPDQQFYGEIVELASVIHTKSRNQPARVFDATVSMNKPDKSVMRPGMSVSAEIHMTKQGETGP
jgi:multidrug efflux pump subunit AcrA (membrane-fusion protein)